MTPKATFFFLVLALYTLGWRSSAQPLGNQPSPQPNDGFQSGGIAPLPPMQGEPKQEQPSFETETERKLTEAEKADAGRGLEWAYINVEGGYQFMSLGSFNNKDLTYGSVKDSGHGWMLGAGAGIRLLFYTIGARARMGTFEHWNVLTLNAEGGFHIPLGELEPYLTLGGGYATLRSFDKKYWAGEPKTNGWNGRAGFGLDYYVTPVFSVGANLTGEVIFLKREHLTISPDANLTSEVQDKAASDGSSSGASFTSSLVLGLHF